MVGTEADPLGARVRTGMGDTGAEPPGAVPRTGMGDTGAEPPGAVPRTGIASFTGLPCGGFWAPRCGLDDSGAASARLGGAATARCTAGVTPDPPRAPSAERGPAGPDEGEPNPRETPDAP
ncbi:hypothetical protein N4G70_28155 [Streptomyces sp. ASQP_92]|uniref:hypothetical protein n=1 Tax=Streptomyces sp. ASQP_92 TaxID=2979116 RepID=UPI0021C0757A|nr:hypothetical protein [Streptomyces sp. ASQP_92]MCT9092712.1 hypothetical protein [Streptomyces sp. ASQP_92]